VRQRSLGILLGAAAGLLVSCSSGPSLNPPFAEIREDRIVLRTGHFEIPPGDVFECFYTPLVADRDLIVTRAEGRQEAGGHHLTVYYTMVHQDPGHHPCIDEEMATWRQVGAAEDGPAAEYWVDGLGMRIPAGAQIVLQAHYINLEGTRLVEDRVDVLLSSLDRIRHLGAPYVVHDADFEIPARASVRHVAECVVARDLQIGLLLGHMHEWGIRFSLERVNADGTTEMLYDEPWEASYASHPPVARYGLDHPLVLPAGTRLRQTCAWMNPETEPMVFPREMCVAYMVLFPSETGEMEFCEVESRRTERLR
jgi:hypothetical protein